MAEKTLFRNPHHQSHFDKGGHRGILKKIKNEMQREFLINKNPEVAVNACI
jgi:hypothetical protein